MNKRINENKTKITWKSHSLCSYIYFGLIILGIGCICFVTYNIFEQYYYVSKISIQNDIIKSSDVKQNSIQNPTLSKKVEYAIYPVEGENIGTITMPSLNQEFPIFQGTGAKELKKGVGHFLQSVLPGEEDNCILSGHRETVFAKIGELKISDQVIVKTSAGIFIYEVMSTRIVHKDDKTVIVPSDHAVLTMTTCYPFNPLASILERYIVSADLVKTE